jgi:hypothetical protein
VGRFRRSLVQRDRDEAAQRDPWRRGAGRAGGGRACTTTRTPCRTAPA